MTLATKTMTKNNQNKLVGLRSSVNKGEIYCFDPAGKTVLGKSPLVLILSGEVHNKRADYFIIALVSKHIEPIRHFFEVVCEIENKKYKLMASVIHITNRKYFLENAQYLGKIDETAMKKVNEEIKLILKLDY